MRSERAIKNSTYVMLQKISEVVLAFIYRTFFINVLGVTYLGISGLFSNIFGVLSLVELGMSSSIVFLMYEPLSKMDKEKIKSLLKIYSKFYSLVAIIITVIGIGLIPFLPYLIKDYNEININLVPIYLLMIAATVSSYYAAHNRSLLEADQKNYINSLNYTTFNIISTIVRIVALLLFKNYIVCLIISTLITLISNICINIKVKKMYPFLKEKNVNKLPKKVYKEIYARMGAVTMHQIGNVIVTSTDNILISVLISIGVVGIYSNYIMITTTLYTMFSLIFCSITSIIGNMKIKEDLKKCVNTFDNLFFLNFVLYFIATTTFYVIANKFILCWIGEGYIFDWLTVALITLNLYITGMRHVIVTFINSSGLNYDTRYKAIVEAVLNLIISLILGKLIGINGIIIGTILSFVLVSVWYEPYVLYKKWLKDGLKKYYLKYLICLILTISTSYALSKILSVIPSNNMFEVILQGMISVIICIIVIILLFNRTKEFKYFWDFTKGLVKKQIVNFKR